MQIHDRDFDRAAGAQRPGPAGRTGAPGPRRAGSISPARLLALQRTAGNAATGRLLQRLLVGEDPLEDLKRNDARGLIYGTSSARNITSRRLGEQDRALALDRYRTIDAYNDAVGISQNFSPSTGKAAAIGIFRLREALAEADPVAAWMRHFPAAPKDPKLDPDLRDWVVFLKSRANYVGLYDLADDHASSAGSTRVGAKHRFTKNLLNDAWAKQTTLTPQKLGQWLRADRTYDQANSGFEAAFAGKDEQLHLAKWMYSAFFRRTSKVGIDFTTSRGHAIHLNIAADPTYDPSNPALPKLTEKGLVDIQATDQAYGRSITSSEYRHARKLVDEGRTGPGRVNFYSEIKDPPPPPVVAPPPATWSWIRPWTWFW